MIYRRARVSTQRLAIMGNAPLDYVPVAKKIWEVISAHKKGSEKVKRLVKENKPHTLGNFIFAQSLRMFKNHPKISLRQLQAATDLVREWAME